MLRISAVAQAKSTILKLEGKLLEPWCEELDLAARQASDRKLPVELDLKDVSFVDQAGAQSVRRLLSDGIRLGRCSNFIAELLKQEQL